MSIVKGEFETAYLQLPNTTANDKNLSCEALGVLTYLISKSSNWIVQKKELQSRFKCGRDKINRVITELIGCGYIVSTIKRSGGKFNKADYTVYQEPFSPLTENPLMVSADSPLTENPPLTKERTILNKDSTKSELDLDLKESSLADSSKNFNIFWELVDRKESRMAAEKIFNKHIKDKVATAQEIIDGQKKYRAYCRADKKEKQWLRKPNLWLRDGDWANELEPVNSTNRPSIYG